MRNGGRGFGSEFRCTQGYNNGEMQKGHMELHARNLAIMAGAKPGEAGKVAELAVKLARERGRRIGMDMVEEALKLYERKR